MNFEVLRYFITAEKVGSFTGAADQLFLSQQGLNKSITHLEDELGCQLIVRSKQGIELTQNGQIFLKHAKRIMLGYEDMIADFQSYQREIELLNNHQIMLTVSHICFVTIVTPMLKRNELPTISLVETDTVKALKQMNTAQKNAIFLLDLSPHTVPDDDLRKDFVVLPIVTAKLGLITRKSLVPQLPRVVPMRQIAKLPLGLYDTETVNVFYRDVYKDYPLENIVFSTKSHSALVEGMLAGRFAFLADSFFWDQLPQHLKRGEDNIIFAQIENSEPLVFAFMYKKDNPPAQESLNFINSFIAIVRRMNGLDS